MVTDGAFFIYTGPRQTNEDLLRQYKAQWAALADPESEANGMMPDELREGFRPVLLSLLCDDPTRRASVEDLKQNLWLMNEDMIRL